MSFQKVKGTADFYPEEKEMQNRVFSVLRAMAVKYGFSEVESPAFEYLKVLTEKEGEEIKKQVFVLEKRSDEELGLRFDLTVPLARMFIEKQKTVPKPVKWFYLTRMWRYEQPQQGRAREFYQFGVELFGSDKPEADAEAINLVIDSLTALGLAKNDFFIKINNRKLLEGLLTDFIEKNRLEEAIRIIDKKSKVSEKEFETELKGIKLNNDQINKIKNLLKINKIEEIEKLKLNEEASRGFEELKNILKFVKKEFVRIDLSAARGLAYYTGTVFECFDAEQKFRAIAGGGRYDRMIEQFGGEPCPATGFGMGYSTLMLLLEDKKLMPKIDPGPDYFVAILNDDVREDALKIVDKLRKKYSVDYDLSRRNLGNQLKYANSIKAKKLIVIGEDEIRKKEVRVKDMKTGKEEIVSLDKL
ncbi:histidine--tRNA ligase [Candidatus Woesearchaeota archaeon]|nr:histidine--tRNA ligase [Candidatus Woesearchaeota archaeon]